MHADDSDRVAFTFAFTWWWVRAEKWPSSNLKYTTELFEANENDKFMFKKKCRMTSKPWRPHDWGENTVRQAARDTTNSNCIWCNNSWMILCVTEKRISEINRDVCDDCELWRRNKLSRTKMIRNENHPCVCNASCPLVRRYICYECERWKTSAIYYSTTTSRS